MGSPKLHSHLCLLSFLPTSQPTHQLIFLLYYQRNPNSPTSHTHTISTLAQDAITSCWIIAIASQLGFLPSSSSDSHSFIRMVLLKVILRHSSDQSPQVASHLRVKAEFFSRIYTILPNLPHNSIFPWSFPTPPPSIVIITQQTWLPYYSLPTPSAHLFSLPEMPFPTCLCSSFPHFFQVTI